MTVLDCTVSNCSYNRDRSCRKDNIQVEGSEAHVTSDTCCGSFELKGCGCSNADCGCPSKKTDVFCKAEECVFNHSMKCGADHISISGGKADTSAETECASFDCR